MPSIRACASVACTLLDLAAVHDRLFAACGKVEFVVSVAKFSGSHVGRATFAFTFWACRAAELLTAFAGVAVLVTL